MSSFATTLRAPARLLAPVRAAAGAVRVRLGVVAGRARVAGRSLGAVARPLWNPLRPFVAVVSAFGWTLLVLAIASWSAGQVFGWFELTVIAVVAVAALLLATLFILGRSSYAVVLDLASTRVVVGQRAVGRVEVRNDSTRSLLPARIELPVGKAFASFQLPRLAGQETHEDLFTIPTDRRTVLTVGPVRSVRDDPLGLLRRQVRWTEPQPLYVHPHTVSLDGASSGFLKDLEGLPTKELSVSDVSFHALREYVPGDDRRHIHWKTSARMDKLMVRQFEETRRSHLAVALSTTVADYFDPDQFELAVSACGSLGLQALKEEKQLTVLVQGRTLRARTGKRLLDELSGVDRSESRDDIVQLAKAAAIAVPDASVVVMLFGGEVTASQMRRAANQLPLGAAAVALSCVPGAAISRRSIGDLVVLTIGSLDELPAVMRRVSG